MIHQLARWFAALPLIGVACTACVAGDARKAAELNWSRPDAGQRWCQVLGNSEITALIEAADESGSPWQTIDSGEFE